MKLISFVVVFFITFIVAVKAASMTKEHLETLRNLSAGCLKELGANEALFDEMIKNQPATSQDIKCLRACIMKQLNLLTSDGKFNKDNALKFAAIKTGGDADKMKIAREIADACEIIPVPEDHCEAAEMYKMCLVSEAKKHGIDCLA